MCTDERCDHGAFCTCQERCSRPPYEKPVAQLRAEAEQLAQLADLGRRTEACESRDRALREAAVMLIERNGGPIEARDTVDGIDYVMVRWTDFNALVQLVERAARDQPEAAADPHDEHGPACVPCDCYGCPETVPGCWATPMCRPCAAEECEHGEPAREEQPRG